LIEREGLAEYYRWQDGAGRPPDAPDADPASFVWADRLQSAAEAGAARPELSLRIEGMHCPACVWLIERVARRGPEVLLASASLVEGTLRLRWRPGGFRLSEFLLELARFGYRAEPERPGPVRLDGLAWRVLLCALFGLNAWILFWIDRTAGSLGGSSALIDLCRWAVGLLALAVGGGYFLAPTLRAARQGRWHFDGLISTGLLGCLALAAFGPGREGYWAALPWVLTALLLVRRVQQGVLRGLRRAPPPASAVPVGPGSRWMASHQAVIGLVILTGFAWSIASAGMQEAVLRLAAACFAPSIYAAELMVEEGRSARAVLGAVAPGLIGVALSLTGILNLSAALAWHGGFGILLVLYLARSEAAAKVGPDPSC